MTHLFSSWIPHSLREFPGREGSLVKPQPSWGSSPHKLSKDELPLTQNKPRVMSPTPHTTRLVRPQSHSRKTNSWGYSWVDAVGNSPGDMESLPAAVSVTGHACSRGCFALPALLFTDVAGLKKKKNGKVLTPRGRQSVCFTLTVHQEAKLSRMHNSVSTHLPPVTTALGYFSVACTKLMHLLFLP